ncbi:MAG: hypothetical protein A2Z83_01935 [Omnitrophica bacterium GWA2_52_8]|nr:MAG: hypothetical protein A2Z83_01935 [Omnitrophica bacterium GWA2_52_8]
MGSTPPAVHFAKVLLNFKIARPFVRVICDRGMRLMQSEKKQRFPIQRARERLAVFGIFFTALFLFLACFIEPISRTQSHYNRMILAMTAALFVCACFYFKWASPGEKILSWKGFIRGEIPGRNLWLAGAMAGASLFGFFNYYQFDKSLLVKNSHIQDTTYYYINSKYFKELDYFDLFSAMIIADKETRYRLKHLKFYRNLEDYKMAEVKKAFSEQARIKANFSETRWRSFKEDVNYFIERDGPGSWEYFFSDHGYNAPPTWTLVGGTLSERVPLKYCKYITMIDFVLVVLMFAAIGWAFGVEVLLFSLLFFFCTFSGRWPILGQSLLRFDWLAALVTSVCAFKRKRFGWAGALLAYASLNRVFPAIFFFPYGVILLRDLYQTRRISFLHRRFLKGAFLTMFVLVGAAWAAYGSKPFQTSARNLALHQTASYSSHRVGLADALVYRGEKTRAEMNRNGGLWEKQKQINQMRPLKYGLALAAMLLTVFYIVRKKKNAYEVIWHAVLPLFCLTTPQINYFNLRLLLVMWHLSGGDRFRDFLGLVMLFLIEAAAQYTLVSGYERYTTTSITSVGLCLYFLSMMIALIIEMFSRKNKGLEPKVVLPSGQS